MLRFVIRRLSLIGVTLLVVSLAIFLVTEILPGDVATMILRQGATEENLAVVRHDLGLDRPAHERYLGWIGSAVRGDLGDSYKQKRPITEVVKPRLSNSAILAVFAGTLGAWLVVTQAMQADWSFVTLPALGTALAGIALTVVFGYAGTWIALGQKAAPVLRTQ